MQRKWKEFFIPSKHTFLSLVDKKTPFSHGFSLSSFQAGENCLTHRNTGQIVFFFSREGKKKFSTLSGDRKNLCRHDRLLFFKRIFSSFTLLQFLSLTRKSTSGILVPRSPYFSWPPDFNDPSFPGIEVLQYHFLPSRDKHVLRCKGKKPSEQAVHSFRAIGPQVLRVRGSDAGQQKEDLLVCYAQCCCCCTL